jgi:1-phosphofructokinase
MIVTVTLNPALDKTLDIEEFTLDSVNRINNIRMDAGGKGINVSKVLKELSMPSVATGFLGGETGNYIKHYLDTIAVKNDFVFIKDPTRENIKIVDQKNNTFTDINDPGPVISAAKTQEFKEKIKTLADENQLFILAGSIPQGLDQDIYYKIIDILKSKDAFVVLDTYGKPFTEALAAKPDLIKPNIEELEDYLGIKLTTKEEIIAAVKEHLIEKGITYVAVSLGADGALLISKDQSLYAKGMNVHVKSTVGAGDAMVAGLVYGFNNKLPLKEILKYGSASATANVMTAGSKTGEIEQIESLLNQIEVKEL